MKIENLMMKKMNLLVVMISLMMACSSDDEKGAEISNTFLLAGDGSKEWYLAETSGDESGELEACKVGGAMQSDNTYTFKTDGTILFDHGTITTVESEGDVNGCSDLKNYVGEWSFVENETKLSWEILHEQGKPEVDFNLEPDVMTIVKLTEDELQVEAFGEINTFRSK